MTIPLASRERGGWIFGSLVRFDHDAGGGPVHVLWELAWDRSKIEEDDRVSIVIHNNFFFQAEDGIRDLTVTGVQTCALPIYTPRYQKRPPPPPSAT